MKKRILVLPVSAVILVLLVIYKNYELAQRPRPRTTQVVLERPAPRFEAFDADNRRVRLERYLGRHPVLVVFFDAERGADGDSVLQALAREHETIAGAGAKVVAISSALPQQNRVAREGGKLAFFDLLTDPEPHPIHAQWGRLRGTTCQTGLFLVDRAGNVTYQGDVPRPMSVEAALQELRDHL